MVTAAREFQGTIASQMRVRAIDRRDAEQQLLALAAALGDGVIIDEWGVPLIRDMDAESARAPRHTFNVQVTLTVEAPSLDTSDCAAREFASKSMHVSNGMVDPDLRQQIADHRNAIGFYERLRDASIGLLDQRGEQEATTVIEMHRAAIESAQSVLGRTEEKYGQQMIQGRIVSYNVEAVKQNS